MDQTTEISNGLACSDGARVVTFEAIEGVKKRCEARRANSQNAMMNRFRYGDSDG